MRHLSIVCVSLSLALLSVFHEIRADESAAIPRPDLWCADSYPYDRGHPLSFESLENSTDIQSLIAKGDWREADTRVADKFQRFVEERNLSGTELDEFKAGLSFYLSEPTQTFARWQPLDAQGEHLIYELPIGSGMPSVAVRVSCDAVEADEGAAAIAYTAVSLYRIGEIAYPSALKIAAAKLDSVYQTHRDRLFNGLPMWPWEHWINGLDIDFEKTSPTPAPRYQWIFLRPSLSPALKFDGNENSELEAAIVVEPVGFVRYTNEDYSKWIGVSPIVTATNSSGIGYGALARYGNWQIGAAYHEKDSDVLLYASIDLYDLVVGKETRSSSANQFLQKLATKLSEQGASAVGK